MSELKHAESFRDLIVYQKSHQLQRENFRITKSFPKEEVYSLTDQIRRSSRSIGANIAEAWAKRRYERDFICKLTDSDGEQMETQHWIETAFDCKYLDQSTSIQLLDVCLQIGHMLGGIMKRRRCSAVILKRLMRMQQNTLSTLISNHCLLNTAHRPLITIY